MQTLHIAHLNNKRGRSSFSLPLLNVPVGSSPLYSERSVGNNIGVYYVPGQCGKIHYTTMRTALTSERRAALLPSTRPAP